MAVHEPVAHVGHTPLMFVADLDGDGRAELMIKRFDDATQVFRLGGQNGPVPILDGGAVNGAVGIGC